MKNDDELKGLFRRLRRQDARRLPAFEALLRGRDFERRGRSSWVPVAAALVLLLAGGSWWLQRAPETAAPAGGQAGTTWSTPSDFLLELPGGELLGPPSFGHHWLTPEPPGRAAPAGTTMPVPTVNKTIDTKGKGA